MKLLSLCANLEKKKISKISRIVHGKDFQNAVKASMVACSTISTSMPMDIVCFCTE